MSSTYSASSGAPPNAAAAPAAAEPRRIRRAVALPSAEDPLTGAPAAKSAHGAVAPDGGAVLATTTTTFAAAAASRGTRPASEPGRSGGRRLHRAGRGPAPAADVDGPTEQGLPGAVAGTGRTASAASARGGAGRGAGKPLLVAAAFAGAVLSSLPFVTHHGGGKADYEGLGQQVPVASQAPDTGGVARPDGQASVMPLRDPAQGTAAPVVPRPQTDPATASGTRHTDTTGPAGTKAGIKGGDTALGQRLAGSPLTPSGPAGRTNPGRSDSPLITPLVGSGRSVLGPVGVMGAGIGALAAEDRSGPVDTSHAGGGTTAGRKAATVGKASTPAAAVHSSSRPSAARSPVTTATTKSTRTEPVGTAHHVKAAATPAAPVKAATPVKPAATSRQWGTRVVTATTVLGPGDHWASDRMTVTMRTDGNLVITDENGTVRWSSHTQGRGYKAVFQDDGHFVVYTKDDRTAWSSGTAGNPGARLVIQADGNVTILSSGGAVLWAAGTQH